MQSVCSWLAQWYAKAGTGRGSDVLVATADVRPPTAILEAQKKRWRSKNGLQMLMKSDIAPKKGPEPIGAWAHACHVKWTEITEEQRSGFTAEAAEVNAAALASREARKAQEEDDGPPE